MRFSFVVMLCAGACVRAQSTPEIRAILDRLQKVEDANRALTEEVRSLREQLAVARPTAPAAGQPSEPVQDQLAVEKSRVEEMAQSKVEASQKMPLRITGMALFNTYVNGRFNGNTDNTTIASLARADATGGGTLRQSILGLQFESPQNFLGGKVTGSIYTDFYGGSAASLNHLVRLRTATISLDWSQTSLSFGQEKPIISPRDPDSLAQVGISPLTGAGNLWLWQPQIRLEQRLSLGRDSGLRAQVGVFQTSLLNGISDPNAYASPQPGQPTEDSSPGGEGRLEFWRRWSETGRVEIAGGFHANRNHVGPFSLPSDVYSLDWFFRPFSKVEFSGLFFHGRNVAVLGGLT